MTNKLPPEEKKERLRKLSNRVLIGFVLLPLIVLIYWIVFVERYGIWFWLLWLIPIGALIFLALRYPRFRNILKDVSRKLWKPRVQIPQQTRYEVYQRAGNRCEWRKGNRRCKGRVFDIYHIDGNPKNRQPSNLIALCANHHWQADQQPKYMLKDWVGQDAKTGKKKS